MFFGVFFLTVSLIGCQSSLKNHQPNFLQKTDIGPFLFKTLVDRGINLKDLKSFAKAVVYKSGKKHSLRQTIVVRGVDSLRIDVLSLFNQPLGLFIWTKGRTVLFDSNEKKYYENSQALEIVERILKMELNFEEFIPLVSGNIPFIHQLKLVDSWLSEDGLRYKLNLESKDATQKMVVEMDATTRLPIKLTKIIKGKTIFVTTWGNFKAVGNYDLPHLVELSHFDGTEKLLVKLNSPVLNSNVKESVFELKVPAN